MQIFLPVLLKYRVIGVWRSKIFVKADIGNSKNFLQRTAEKWAGILRRSNQERLLGAGESFHCLCSVYFVTSHPAASPVNQVFILWCSPNVCVLFYVYQPSLPCNWTLANVHGSYVNNFQARSSNIYHVISHTLTLCCDRLASHLFNMVTDTMNEGCQPGKELNQWLIP